MMAAFESFSGENNPGEIHREGDTCDDRECNNCKILTKKLSISRDWNNFYQQKLENADKFLHIVADYERERQHNVELQLAYDQRSRESSYIRESMANLLLEVEPLREKMRKMEKHLEDEKQKRERAENQEHNLLFTIEQQKHQISSLREKVDTNLIEILEKKLTAARSEIKRLKNSVDDKACEISELKEFIADRRLHFERNSKKVLWSLKLAKGYGLLLHEKGWLLGDMESPEWNRLKSLLEVSESVLCSQYQEFRKKEEKRLRNNLVEIALLPSLERWLDDFDAGLNELFEDYDFKSFSENVLAKEAMQLDKLIQDDADVVVSKEIGDLQKNLANSECFITSTIAAVQGPEKKVALQGPEKKVALQGPEKKVVLQGPEKKVALQGPKKIPAVQASLKVSLPVFPEVKANSMKSKPKPHVQNQRKKINEKKILRLPSIMDSEDDDDNTICNDTVVQKSVDVLNTRTPEKESFAASLKLHDTTCLNNTKNISTKNNTLRKFKQIKSDTDDSVPETKQISSVSPTRSNPRSHCGERMSGKKNYNHNVSRVDSDSEEDIIRKILDDMKPLDKLSCLESSWALQDSDKPLHSGESKNELIGNNLDKNQDNQMDLLNDNDIFGPISDSDDDDCEEPPKKLVSQVSEEFPVTDITQEGADSMLNDLGISDSDEPDERETLEIIKSTHLLQRYRASQSFSVDNEDGQDKPPARSSTDDYCDSKEKRLEGVEPLIKSLNKSTCDLVVVPAVKDLSNDESEVLSDKEKKSGEPESTCVDRLPSKDQSAEHTSDDQHISHSGQDQSITHSTDKQSSADLSNYLSTTHSGNDESISHSGNDPNTSHTTNDITISHTSNDQSSSCSSNSQSITRTRSNQSKSQELSNFEYTHPKTKKCKLQDQRHVYSAVNDTNDTVDDAAETITKGTEFVVEEHHHHSNSIISSDEVLAEKDKSVDNLEADDQKLDCENAGSSYHSIEDIKSAYKKLLGQNRQSGTKISNIKTKTVMSDLRNSLESLGPTGRKTKVKDTSEHQVSMTNTEILQPNVQVEKDYEDDKVPLSSIGDSDGYDGVNNGSEDDGNIGDGQHAGEKVSCIKGLDTILVEQENIKSKDIVSNTNSRDSKSFIQGTDTINKSKWNPKEKVAFVKRDTVDIPAAYLDPSHSGHQVSSLCVDVNSQGRGVLQQLLSPLSPVSSSKLHKSWSSSLSARGDKSSRKLLFSEEDVNRLNISDKTKVCCVDKIQKSAKARYQLKMDRDSSDQVRMDHDSSNQVESDCDSSNQVRMDRVSTNQVKMDHEVRDQMRINNEESHKVRIDLSPLVENLYLPPAINVSNTQADGRNIVHSGGGRPTAKDKLTAERNNTQNVSEREKTLDVLHKVCFSEVGISRHDKEKTESINTENNYEKTKLNGMKTSKIIVKDKGNPEVDCTVMPTENGVNDKSAENGVNDKPAENGVNDKSAENGVNDKPAENGVNDKPAENGVNDKPAENGVNDKSAENGVNDKSAENGVNDKPAENGVNDKSAENGVNDKSAENGVNDKSAENGVNDKPAENGVNDKSAENGVNDKPAENGVNDKSAENGVNDKSAENGVNDKSAENGVNDKSAENGVNDKSAENGVNDKPAENGVNDKPAENGVNDKSAENGVNDKSAENGVNDKSAENGVNDKPAENGVNDKSAENGVNDKSAENGVNDKSAENGVNDKPAENGVNDKSAENGVNDKSAENGVNDKSAENGVNDKSAENGVNDKSAENGVNDKSAENGVNDKPAENGVTDKPAENGVTDKLTVCDDVNKATENDCINKATENGVNDKPAENGVNDKSAENGVNDKSAENGVNDKSAENGVNDKPAENGVNDKPAENGVNDKSAENGVNDKPAENGVNDKSAENGVNDKPAENGVTDKLTVCDDVNKATENDCINKATENDCNNRSTNKRNLQNDMTDTVSGSENKSLICVTSKTIDATCSFNSSDTANGYEEIKDGPAAELIRISSDISTDKKRKNVFSKCPSIISDKKYALRSAGSTDRKNKSSSPVKDKVKQEFLASDISVGSNKKTPRKSTSSEKQAKISETEHAGSLSGDVGATTEHERETEHSSEIRLRRRSSCRIAEFKKKKLINQEKINQIFKTGKRKSDKLCVNLNVENCSLTQSTENVEDCSLTQSTENVEDCSLTQSTENVEDCSLTQSTENIEDCSLSQSTENVEDCSLTQSTENVEDCSLSQSSENIEDCSLSQSSENVEDCSLTQSTEDVQDCSLTQSTVNVENCSLTQSTENVQDCSLTQSTEDSYETVSLHDGEWLVEDTSQPNLNNTKELSLAIDSLKTKDQKLREPSQTITIREPSQTITIQPKKVMFCWGSKLQVPAIIPTGKKIKFFLKSKLRKFVPDLYGIHTLAVFSLENRIWKQKRIKYLAVVNKEACRTDDKESGGSIVVDCIITKAGIGDYRSIGRGVNDIIMKRACNNSEAVRREDKVISCSLKDKKGQHMLSKTPIKKINLDNELVLASTGESPKRATRSRQDLFTPKKWSSQTSLFGSDSSCPEESLPVYTGKKLKLKRKNGVNATSSSRGTRVKNNKMSDDSSRRKNDSQSESRGERNRSPELFSSRLDTCKNVKTLRPKSSNQTVTRKSSINRQKICKIDKKISTLSVPSDSEDDTDDKKLTLEEWKIHLGISDSDSRSSFGNTFEGFNKMHVKCGVMSDLDDSEIESARVSQKRRKVSPLKKKTESRRISNNFTRKTEESKNKGRKIYSEELSNVSSKGSNHVVAMSPRCKRQSGSGDGLEMAPEPKIYVRNGEGSSGENIKTFKNYQRTSEMGPVQINNNNTRGLPVSQKESAFEIASRLKAAHMRIHEKKRTAILLNDAPECSAKQQRKRSLTSMSKMPKKHKGAHAATPEEHKEGLVATSEEYEGGHIAKPEEYGDHVATTEEQDHVAFPGKHEDDQKTFENWAGQGEAPEKFNISLTPETPGDSLEKKREDRLLPKLCSSDTDDSEAELQIDDPNDKYFANNEGTLQKNNLRQNSQDGNKVVEGTSIKEETPKASHPGLMGSLARLGTLDRPRVVIPKPKPAPLPPPPRVAIPASPGFVDGLFSKRSDGLKWNVSNDNMPKEGSKSDNVRTANYPNKPILNAFNPSTRAVNYTERKEYPRQSDSKTFQTSLSGPSFSWYTNRTSLVDENYVQPPSLYGSSNILESEPSSTLDSQNYLQKYRVKDHSAPTLQQTSFSSEKLEETESAAEEQKECVCAEETTAVQVPLVADQDATYLEALRDLGSCKIKSKLWYTLINELCNSLTSAQLLPLIRDLIECILEADPQEYRERPTGFTPTLFKLFQAVCVLELRLELPQFYLREMIIEIIHNLICKPSVDLQPNSLACLSMWYTATVAIPDKKGVQRWELARTFLLDLLFHHPGKVHLALLSAVSFGHKLFHRVVRYRAYTGIEKVMVWVTFHGEWTGSDSVRRQLVEWLERHCGLQKPPPQHPSRLAHELLTQLAGTSDKALMMNLVTSIIVLARWLGRLDIQKHLLPTLKKITYKKTQHNKIPMKTDTGESMNTNTEESMNTDMEESESLTQEIIQEIALLFSNLDKALKTKCKDEPSAEGQDAEQGGVVMELNEAVLQLLRISYKP